MKTKEEITNLLPHFCGTTQWFKAMLGIRFTEGVKYVAESCEAYWLIDAICSYQISPKVRHIPFQIWELIVNEKTAILTMEDTGTPEIVTQKSEYSDFPLDEIKMWLVNNVIMLPSEY